MVVGKHLRWILKNHGNIPSFCLFGQITKPLNNLLNNLLNKLLNNFEPWKPQNYKQLWGLEPGPRCL